PCQHLSIPTFPTRRSSDLIGDHKKSIDDRPQIAGFQPSFITGGVGRFFIAPVSGRHNRPSDQHLTVFGNADFHVFDRATDGTGPDRKSTRLNSSHVSISYA